MEQADWNETLNRRALRMLLDLGISNWPTVHMRISELCFLKSSLCGKSQIILSLSYNNLRSKWLMGAQDEPRRDRDVFRRVDWSQEKHDWGEDESVYVYPCWTLAYRRSGKKPKTTPTRMNNGNDTAFSQRQPQQSREWLFRRRLAGFGVDDRDYVQKLDCICMALVLE